MKSGAAFEMVGSEAALECNDRHSRLNATAMRGSIEPHSTRDVVQALGKKRSSDSGQQPSCPEPFTITQRHS